MSSWRTPRRREAGQLAPVYLLLAIGWACLNSNPISSTVLAWSGDESATPLTVALTGASAGGIIIPLLVWLSGRLGLTAGLALVGLAEILTVGALAVFVIHAPDRADASLRHGPIDRKETQPISS